jgi:ComF family protein
LFSIDQNGENLLRTYLARYWVLTRKQILTDQANPKSTSFWKNKIIGFVFPTACASCGKLGPMICSPCQSRFCAIESPICLRCGRPSTKVVVTCLSCRGEEFNLIQSRACFKYSEPLESVIKQFKYGGLHALAKPLGLLMAQKWPDWAQYPDMIVPIPLHVRRLRNRGFNQAQLLACQIGPVVGLEVNNHALRRERRTRPQVDLSPSERKKNVRRAFSAEPKAVKGKSILLIDDVFTTGATLNSAAGTLLQAGAHAVSAYCLARAVH